MEVDKEILNIISLDLEGDCHTTILSWSGAVILDVKSIKPDLILMDEWLGTEQGSNLCRKLKFDPATDNIRYISGNKFHSVLKGLSLIFQHFFQLLNYTTGIK